MSRAIQEERQAEKLKKLLSFAQTLVFKDEEKAYSFETPLSIELSNYYISARTEDLPYLPAFDKKGFPSSLNDYNLIPNGIQYFIESYELNSKYVGSDEYRYKQVRESTYLTNMNQVDPAYKGNIFELNAYYRSLYNELNVDILKARTTKNYGILYYESAYAEGIDIERFNNIYIETRSWFTHALENRAMQWDPNHRIFNLWMIVIFTIFAYLDEELEKAFNYDLFDQYDIRNMLYSFGITFLNFLPQDFQLRVLKNLKPLLRAKGTDKIFDIVIKDIFGYNAVQVYKYYLVRSNSIEDQVITEYKQGVTSLKKVLDSSSYESLYFIRVPYDVNNISQYLAENPIKTEDKISFSDVTLNDPYWSNDVKEGIILESFANSPYIIESKYLDVGNSSSFIPDIAGVTLFFSMLHDTSYSIPLSFHPFGDGSLDMFGHFIITFYAILRKNLPNSGSISTPPSAYINATDIIGRVFSLLNSQDKLNDHFGTGNKYQSLTLKDLERKNIHLYLATNEGFINESHLETIETEDTIYNGLGQKFKSNFETLKALYKALRYVAYSNQEIIGIGPKDEDFTNPGYLIDRLKSEINSSLFNTLNEDDPDYSKALAVILGDSGYTIGQDHNTPGIRNLIEKANLILNEEALFEARTELGNKYGEAFGDLDSYLSTVYPVTYKKVNDAFTSGNEQDILSVINELYSTLNLSLREITVRVPENTGVKSSLSEDINFKSALKEYVLPYAIRLLEYFMSYTVQIRNSGTVNDVTNDGAETIQVLDMLDTQSSRSNVVMDYIFTGKNCNPEEWPENGTDLDRHGLNKDSVTYEPLLDEAMGVVRVLANTVSQPSESYELNASEAVYPDLVSSNPDSTGYGRHGESINFKESLYAYVRNATDLTEVNSIDIHDMVAVIGGPVLVSGKPSGIANKSPSMDLLINSPNTDDFSITTNYGTFTAAKVSDCPYFDTTVTHKLSIRDVTFSTGQKLSDDSAVRGLFVGVESWGTTNTYTNTLNLFSDCSHLRGIPTSWDGLGWVTDARSMFNGCTSLTRIPASWEGLGWVTDAGNMFRGCTSLTRIPASWEGLGAVANAGNMFRGCTSLTRIPASWEGLGWVTDASYMFSGCTSLTRIPASWEGLGKLANARNMFYNCTSLTSIPMSWAGLGELTNAGSMFYNCPALTSIPMLWEGLGAVTNASYMFNGCISIASIPASWEGLEAVTNAGYMFYGCTSLTSIPTLWDGLEAVTNADSMFYRCTSLTSIPESWEGLGELTNAGSMFQGCTYLTSIPNSWVGLGKLTTARSMFNGCTSLTSIPTSWEGLEALTNAGNMFYGCTSLTSIPTSWEGLGKLANAGYMFSGCTSLTSIPASWAGLGSVTSTSNMFYRCTSLTSIPTLWDGLGKLINTDSMFFGCTSLASIPDSWEGLGKLANASGMFYGCTSLTSIPTSWEGLGKLANASYMFDTCTSLTNCGTIFTGLAMVTNVRYLFSGCTGMQGDIHALYVYLSTKPVAVSTFSYCFNKCTQAVGYSSIPASWK